MAEQVFTPSALAEYTIPQLHAILDDLNAQREALRERGRAVKAVMTTKLQEEAVLAKLAGLTATELAAVLAAAKTAPELLIEAVAESRRRRTVIEVVANQTEVIGVAVGS